MKTNILLEQSVFTYWTLPIVKKVRLKLSHLLNIDSVYTGEGNSEARTAIINMVRGICDEAGLGAAEVFPSLVGQSVEQIKEPEVSEEEDTPEQQEAAIDSGEFDDRLHANEEMGIPETKALCLAIRKGDLISGIYHEDNKEAIAYLGLPAKAKKCDKKFTHKGLVEFLFKED